MKFLKFSLVLVLNMIFLWVFYNAMENGGL